MRLIYDLETDGLLKDVSVVHCIGVIDADSGEETLYGPDRIAEGLARLEAADAVIGHNIVDYDNEVVAKLYPHIKLPRSIDTRILAHIAWPAIRKDDAPLVLTDKLPRHLAGRYSLEAFGYRFGFPKDDYSARMKEKGLDPWAAYNDEMGAYCLQDCRLQLKLLQTILHRSRVTDDVIDMETALWVILRRMHAAGVWFDEQGAANLLAELLNDKAALEAKLVDLFGVWVRPVWEKVEGEGRKRVRVEKIGSSRQVKLPDWPDVMVRRYSEKTGKELKPYVGPPVCSYVQGEEYCPIAIEPFNPASRKDIADRLISVYGWKPAERTKSGEWKIDETTLESLPPEVPDDIRTALIDYFVLTKTIGALYEGKASWMGRFKPATQRIHGRINQNGTITFRAAHSDPNLGQVPKVLKAPDKSILKGRAGRYGWECRSLFGARPGWELVGCDASGLELRMLGHYMAAYDGGRYADIVVNGDVHEANRIDFELLLRETSKTTIYAMIYGGGDFKLGTIKMSELDRPLTDERKIAGLGKALRGTFVKNNPAFGKLDAQVKASFEARKGQLFTLDRRIVRAKGPHAALNSILQSAGSIVCKRWLVILMERLGEMGLRVGDDFELMLWVHDEVQIECRPGLGETIGRAAVEAIREAGRYYDLKCPLDGEFKVARGELARWAGTH